jgi:Ca-activated chloride channel homolog
MRFQNKINQLLFGIGIGVATFLTLGFHGILGESGAAIQGTVKDETGNPVVGALIGVLDQKDAGLKEAQTDRSGKFLVSDLRGTDLYRIIITKYGYTQVSLEDVRPSVEELTIRLKRDRESSLSPPLTTAKPAQEPGQKPAEKGEEEKAFTLSVAVEEVLLNVSVEDALGRPVTDLQKQDFTVFQDGVEQEVRYFGRENVPLSAVLLMDISSSMQGSPMVEAKVAALAFLDQSQPQDAVSLVAFSDKVEVVRPFTQDMLQVRTGVHSLTARGGTALYDAISKSTELVQKAPHPRHAIILLSDGKDEDSVVKFSALDRTVQESDVVVFSVGEYAELDRKLFMGEKKYYKQPELDVNLNPVWVLRYFAELSGGRAFFPKLGDPLETFFTQIARELHQQYVLTYRPTATSGQGNFHRIDVKASSPKHPTALKVRTRKGFLSK